jgi:hypothetical protein
MLSTAPGTLAALLRSVREHAAHRGVYRADGISVELLAPSAGELAWCDMYLGQYVAAREAPADLSVYLSSRFDIGCSIRELVAQAVPEGECAFYLFRRAKIYRCGDYKVFVPGTMRDKAVVDNAVLPELELYVTAASTIYIFACFAPPSTPTPEAPRLVRDAITKDFLSRGDLLLHASAVALGSRGYAFTGTKGSGKTTLLVESLRHLRASMIANDRVRVHATDTQVELSSWPIVNYFLLSTLKSIGVSVGGSGFRPSYPQQPFWLDPEPDERKKVAVLEHELHSILMATTCNSCELTALFLIERDEGRPTRLQATAELDYVQTFLREQLFTLAERQYPDPFGFACGDGSAGQRTLEFLAHARGVRFYRATGRDTSAAILEFLQDDSPDASTLRQT